MGAMPDADPTGATPDQEAQPEQPTEPEGATPEAGEDEALGESGRRALVSERQARRDAETQLSAMKRELEELQEASKSEAEKAISHARREGFAEATKTANARLTRAEARAIAAAAGWRDPDDALLYVKPESVKVSESGEVDATALTALLAEVAKAKPYLLASDNGGRPRSSRPDAPAIKAGRGPDTPDMDSWLRTRRPSR